MLDASPFGIIATDESGQVQVWSRCAQQIFQWTEAEVLHQPLPSSLHLEAYVHKQVRTAEEHRSFRKDGTEVDVDVYSVVWRDDHGNPRGTLLMISDSTEQHAMRRELQQLTQQESEARKVAGVERRFRELLEAAPDAIIEVDRDGRIALLNRVTEKMFGYTREELLGRNVDLLIPVDLRTAHAKHRSDYWERPQTRSMGSGLKLEAERRDGTRFPVEISLSPVKFEDGFRVTAIIRDISERKEADDRLRAVQEEYTRHLSDANVKLEERNLQVERANRLKSEFLASMSHELRTPLHTIIGFSELLAEQLEGPLNDKQKRFVGHIHKDSMHLLELINDILDLSKIEAGRLELRRETFDAAAVTREAVSSIRAHAEAKSIVVQIQVKEPMTLYADRMRFKQILLNLLSNAVKFTPEGGNVRVEGALRGEDAEFSVVDTGVGIAKQDQESVFDKFYQVGNTTKGVREGTGLGLAITQHLVEEHGGSIRVDSQPGRGSRFTFTIPRGVANGAAESKGPRE